jgi:hypothetical protein
VADEIMRLMQQPMVVDQQQVGRHKGGQRCDQKVL